ncbi:uncharacterized protein [Watersipora subatra]|uniref:uncharacterized protein n=1 Tax=Watersipora subatra TaxID=2589382 RepID=UPI00355BF314
MDYQYTNQPYSVRRCSVSSTISSRSDTPPSSPQPQHQPLTLASLFKDYWSADFAEKYIINYPYAEFLSHYTQQSIFAKSELPTVQNNFCVSNYTLEKLALHQNRYGYDAAILEDLAQHIPAAQRMSFLTKIQTRVDKLMQKRQQLPLCGFCRNNGKPPEVFLSHTARDERGRVSCPTLFKYHCPQCGAKGEDAHTISYCPLSRNMETRQ